MWKVIYAINLIIFAILYFHDSSAHHQLTGHVTKASKRKSCIPEKIKGDLKENIKKFNKLGKAKRPCPPKIAKKESTILKCINSICDELSDKNRTHYEMDKVLRKQLAQKLKKEGPAIKAKYSHILNKFDEIFDLRIKAVKEKIRKNKESLDAFKQAKTISEDLSLRKLDFFSANISSLVLDTSGNVDVDKTYDTYYDRTFRHPWFRNRDLKWMMDMYKNLSSRMNLKDYLQPTTSQSIDHASLLSDYDDLLEKIEKKCKDENATSFALDNLKRSRARIEKTIRKLKELQTNKAQKIKDWGGKTYLSIVNDYKSELLGYKLRSDLMKKYFNDNTLKAKIDSTEIPKSFLDHPGNKKRIKKYADYAGQMDNLTKKALERSLLHAKKKCQVELLLNELIRKKEKEFPINVQKVIDEMEKGALRRISRKSAKEVKKEFNRVTFVKPKLNSPDALSQAIDRKLAKAKSHHRYIMSAEKIYKDRVFRPNDEIPSKEKHLYYQIWDLDRLCRSELNGDLFHYDYKIQLAFSKMKIDAYAYLYPKYVNGVLAHEYGHAASLVLRTSPMVSRLSKKMYVETKKCLSLFHDKKKAQKEKNVVCQNRAWSKGN